MDFFSKHPRWRRGNPAQMMLIFGVILLYILVQEFAPMFRLTAPANQPVSPAAPPAWAQFLSRLSTLTPAQWTFIGLTLFVIVAGLVGLLAVLIWMTKQKPDPERQAWEEERWKKRQDE